MEHILIYSVLKQDIYFLLQICNKNFLCYDNDYFFFY